MILQLRLFATARQAAGRGVDDFELPEGARVEELLAAAVARYGAGFAEVLAASRVWLNGDELPGGPSTRLAEGDEVAVLPPVSGGCR